MQLIKKKTWESSLSKIKVGEILKVNNDSITSKDYELLVIKKKLKFKTIQYLKKKNFIHICNDQLFFLSKFIRIKKIRIDKFKIIKLRNDLIEKVKISDILIKESRFFLDKNYFNLNKKIWDLIIKKIIRERKRLTYCLILKNKLEGICSAKIDNNSAIIDVVYLNKKYKNKGIGKKMMSDLIDNIFKKRIKKIYVSVLSSNLKAIRFYKKIGFKYNCEYNVLHKWNITK